MTRPRGASRITAGLFAAHALGSAGAIATATVAAIVGADLSGRTALAGLPAAAFQIGSALAAVAVGVAIDRLGARNGLSVATVVGAAGMALAGVSALQGLFVPLLLGLLVAGAANAAVRFGRFTAAGVNPAARRGRAVSIVVMGGTVGSVAGPALVAPSGALTAAWGWGELTGPYLATAALFVLTAIVLVALLRPEPHVLAARLEEQERMADAGAHATGPARLRTLRELARDPGVVTAMGSLVLAQGVMVMVMGITSLHMRDVGHGLGLISLVFAGHTLGMYALSLVSGWLTDRLGRLTVLTIGGGTLVTACLIAPLSPRVVPLFVALFLLGYGWNMCYVAGSALLADHLRMGEKARIQGVNDLLMGGVSAASSLSGGVVLATSGFGAMAWAGAVASALLLALVWRHRRQAAPAFAP